MSDNEDRIIELLTEIRDMLKKGGHVHTMLDSIESYVGSAQSDLGSIQSDTSTIQTDVKKILRKDS